MIKHKQLYRHNPITGEIGDCFRTCLACVIEAERVEDIPHFYADAWPPGQLNPEGISSTAVKAAHTWLLDNSALGYFEFPLAAKDNEHLLKWLKYYCSPDTSVIVGCTSKNGGHCVVYTNGEIWDPSLDNSGMLGPMEDGYYWIGCVTYRGWNRS